MPYQCNITQRYWDTCYFRFTIEYPCGWRGKWYKPWKWRIIWCTHTIRIPYPCRKSRTVTGWCYNCTQIRMVCWGFWCTSYCCDDGKEYSWTRPAFFHFGEEWASDGSKSSVEPLEEHGDCIPRPADPEGAPEPVDPRIGPGPTPEDGIGGVTPRGRADD